MSKGRVTFIVTLSCRHAKIYARPAPNIGELVWCERCNEYKHCMSNPMEFSAQCDGCRFSRSYGAAKLAAQYAADKHARAHPGHRVRTYRGSTVLDERTAGKPGPVQLDLLAELDKPPF